MLMKFARLALLAAPLAAWTASASAQDAAAGDPAAGEKVFKKCAACHSLSPDGKAKVGPDLYGVIGRTTGTAEGFKYSEVMTKAGADGHVWTRGGALEVPREPEDDVPRHQDDLRRPEEARGSRRRHRLHQAGERRRLRQPARPPGRVPEAPDARGGRSGGARPTIASIGGGRPLREARPHGRARGRRAADAAILWSETVCIALTGGTPRKFIRD